jgi:uncharacterized protein (TIRG00374 family)
VSIPRIFGSRLFRAALLLLLVGGELALVAPHVSSPGAALGNLRWGWVVAAVACEMASLATFARLRRGLLRAGGLNLSLGRIGALTLASSAISVSMPAGTAVSAGYLYRQLRRAGASAPLVAWMLTAGTVLSVMAFSVITIAGAMLSGEGSLDAIADAGGVSVLLVIGLIALLAVVTRHPRPFVRAGYAVCTRLPWRTGERGGDAVERVVAQVGAIAPRPRDWTAAFWLAIANWAADLACFVMCCYAVGVDRLGVGVAVLAYVAGLATTSISVLPGGLGSVDAGMLFGLTHGGVAAPLALAGILTYRLVAYALVAAVGWVVWAALRRRRVAPVIPAG